MRLFISTATTSPSDGRAGCIEVTRIILHPDRCDVQLAYWQNLDYYLQHGNDYQPQSRQTLTLGQSPEGERLTDFIYTELGKQLPGYQLHYSRPRE